MDDPTVQQIEVVLAGEETLQEYRDSCQPALNEILANPIVTVTCTGSSEELENLKMQMFEDESQWSIKTNRYKESWAANITRFLWTHIDTIHSYIDRYTELKENGSPTNANDKTLQDLQTDMEKSEHAFAFKKGMIQEFSEITKFLRYMRTTPHQQLNLKRALEELEWARSELSRLENESGGMEVLAENMDKASMT
ncbi:uncharacterized protein L199_006130 [Kwoniella botswanensis]|uniref:uncharacterized protein n=1 Tax=Kwoniella botswanensis TaxID=1268659 RepID=UPI00315D44D6